MMNDYFIAAYHQERVERLKRSGRRRAGDRAQAAWLRRRSGTRGSQ
jgi:hypothetical protein